MKPSRSGIFFMGSFKLWICVRYLWLFKLPILENFGGLTLCNLSILFNYEMHFYKILYNNLCYTSNILKICSDNSIFLIVSAYYFSNFPFLRILTKDLSNVLIFSKVSFRCSVVILFSICLKNDCLSVSIGLGLLLVVNVGHTFEIVLLKKYMGI